MKWPARIPAAFVSEQHTIHMDLSATILGAAGTAPTRELDGIDLKLRQLGRPRSRDDSSWAGCYHDLTDDNRIPSCHPMKILLYFVFFLSGVAGLVFEALWFRMAGLTFGNSMWASSLVLSSFMGGLALGNALTARHGFRIHKPVRVYARLEILVGIFGCGLVLLFPVVPQLFAPLFRPFLETPAILNPFRLGLAFVLLLVPTTAMGATLPIMVKALNQWSADFGNVLGQLYGWNTFGAMTGALLAETVLIGAFGVAGSAVVAALVNFTAAGLAFWIHHFGAPAGAPATPKEEDQPARSE